MKRSVCNELFGETEQTAFTGSLKIIRETGFHGVEIAPHTLFGNFSGNLRNTLSDIKTTLDGEGVAFAGFHWLLVGPEGLHVCSPDEKVRGKSWDHIRLLADMAGELGGGPLTFGSPAQRSSRGVSRDIPEISGKSSGGKALELFIRGLSSVAEHVESTGSRLLVEALPSEFTDVVNTLEEARTVIDSIGKPGIGGMFDFHNTDDEKAPWDALIREHRNYISHVHLNDEGGTAPTTVTDEYRKAFMALNEIGYESWVSLEIFTEPENPRSLLEGVRDFLNGVSS
jgi:sugar phosphate isomerase/epimerase